MKALLNFLEDTDKKGDELFSALAEKQEELRYYLEHLPTYWPTKGIIESGFGNRFHPVYKEIYGSYRCRYWRKEIPYMPLPREKLFLPLKTEVMGTVLISITVMVLPARYAHCMKILVKKDSLLVGENSVGR